MMYNNFPLRTAQCFAPTYFHNFWDPSPWINYTAHALGLFCALYWLLPVRERIGRAASLGFFIMCLYFSYMAMPFPWYIPPATLLGLIALISGVSILAARFEIATWPRGLLAAAGLICIGTPIVGFFVLNARLMRIQEKNVEMGNRAQVGLWLKDQVQPNESVFLEPVGYIGYFSGAKIVDFPGLVSPQVVKLMKEKKLSLFSLIPDIQPDWVVLRTAKP